MVVIGYEILQQSFKKHPCSHRVRKKKNQQPQNLCKLLIFSVDQPGLEPGTSRL